MAWNLCVRAVGETGRLHTRRAQDFRNEFASGRIIVNDKNPCRHVILPQVAHGVQRDHGTMGELGIRLRHPAILQPVFQLFSKPFKIDWF